MSKKMIFNQKELDMLMSSVKCFYTHFKCHAEFVNNSISDEVYKPVLKQLNDLYWKLYKLNMYGD